MTPPFPQAASTPSLPSRRTTQSTRALSQSQSALHQSKLKLTVGSIHPEEWLQSVNTCLDLADAQILKELRHFLATEPREWFSVLNSHASTWTDFCELFRTVLLSPDNQEPILSRILDHFQHPEEPLPMFVTHMLGEFRKLRSKLSSSVNTPWRSTW